MSESGSSEQTDGSPGAGGATTVEIDADLNDELIHARHNSAGRQRTHITASDSAYTNKEEEETIATGDLTENDLRREHEMPARHGHSGRDTRPP